MRVLFALVLAGCANRNETATATGPCSPTHVDCPNELAAPLVRECAEAGRDPDCGVSYQSYFQCRQSHQVCDGRGRIDEDASVDACHAEFGAWLLCANPVADSAVVDTAIMADTFVAKDTAVADTKTDAKTD